MTWQDYLKPAERRQLARAQAARDKKADDYNALRIKLKARADSRIRTKKAQDARKK